RPYPRNAERDRLGAGRTARRGAAARDQSEHPAVSDEEAWNRPAGGELMPQDVRLLAVRSHAARILIAARAPTLTSSRRRPPRSVLASCRRCRRFGRAPDRSALE